METVIRSDDIGLDLLVEWSFSFYGGHPSSMHDEGSSDEYEIEVHGIWQADAHGERTGEQLSWSEWRCQESLLDYLECEAISEVAERETERKIEAYEDRKYSI